MIFHITFLSSAHLSEYCPIPLYKWVRAGSVKLTKFCFQMGLDMYYVFLTFKWNYMKVNLLFLLSKTCIKYAVVTKLICGKSSLLLFFFLCNSFIFCGLRYPFLIKWKILLFTVLCRNLLEIYLSYGPSMNKYLLLDWDNMYQVARMSLLIIGEKSSAGPLLWSSQTILCRYLSIAAWLHICLDIWAYYYYVQYVCLLMKCHTLVASHVHYAYFSFHSWGRK